MERFRRHLAYHGILLGGLALVAGTLLATGSSLTDAVISRRIAEDLQASLSQVIPASIHDNDLLKNTVDIDDKGRKTTVYLARQDGEVTAVAFSSKTNGYASTPINFIMGINRDGSILGVRVLAQAETPGLGDKIDEKKSNWILSFNGMRMNGPDDKRWAVKKDGGVFDQFTGATITPRGVVRGVREGLLFFARHKTELLNPHSNAAKTEPQ